MKDAVFLLLVALFVALVSWAFWHYMGGNAVQVLAMLALISLATDNYRLRRQLKRTKPGH
jgi:uncharacterized membrane protein YqjE